jgi:hypothetical protein
VLADSDAAAAPSPSPPHPAGSDRGVCDEWDGNAGEIPKNSSLAAEVLNDYGTDTDAADASKQSENGRT